MRNLNGTLRPAAALATASCVMLAAAGGLGSPARAQNAQPESPTPVASSRDYTSFERRSPDQMAPSDVSLVQAKQQEMVSEAAFFGYFLNSGGWSYDQVLCPDLPDDLLLHYRKTSPGGGVSLFTALVPRAQGRVLIVPILYRNAAPYRSASGAARTITVFNRSVPAETALEAARSGGDWLSLGMTYAVVAGAEPRVPSGLNNDPALTRAPRPTAQLSSADLVQQIIFTDRDAENRIAVWTVALNDAGRATAASLQVYPTASARLVPEGPPLHETAVPPAPPLQIRPVPPAPALAQKPVPQG